MSNGSIVRCQEPSNNSSISSSKSLWPIDEVVDKYYGIEDIEILSHASVHVSLMPSGLLPWENAYRHKYLLLIQELGIKMVLEAHTSWRGAMKLRSEVNALNGLLNISPFKFQIG